MEDNPALDLSGLMGGSSAPDALHLGIAAARASLSNREPSDREPRDAHAHAHGAHPSSSAGSHGSIANENSMATTAVVPAPVLAPMSPRRSLQGLLGSPPVQRPSLFVAPQRPVRLQLVPGGGAAGGQPRTPSRSGDRGKSRLSFNERVKAGNHFGNLGAVAEGSERAEEKQT